MMTRNARQVRGVRPRPLIGAGILCTAEPYRATPGATRARTSRLRDRYVTIPCAGTRGYAGEPRSPRHYDVVPDLTRRAMLRLGAGASAGAAGVWALSAVLDPLEPQAAPQAPAPFEPATAGSTLPNRLTGSFVSEARGGIKTNWVVVMPPGHNRQNSYLRPVIALHGKDGNASQMLELGVEDGLAKMTKEGKPPFAVVGVDGGNTYWHKRTSGGDSGAMVLEELLPMLSTMGIDTSRVAFMGWSMGGYGALLLGSRAGPVPDRGDLRDQPGVVTPRSPAAPPARSTATTTGCNTVCSGLPALDSIPLRVDCGTSDRFYPATRAFVNQLKKPPAGSFSEGGHDVDYWRAQLPGELTWIAYLARSKDDSPAGRHLQAPPRSGAAHLADRIPPGHRGLARRRGGRRCAVSRRHARCGWWLRRRGRVLRHLGLPDHRAALARGEHHRHRPAAPLLRGAGPPTAAGLGHGRRRHRDRRGRLCCRRCRPEASSWTASPARCMSATTGSPCRASTTWLPTCRRRRSSTTGRWASRSSSIWCGRR